MKKTLIALATVPFVANCAVWDRIVSKPMADEIVVQNPDLPGVPTSINCNPEPKLIYSKTGQVIDRIVPVLHPSCTSDGEVLNSRVVAPGTASDPARGLFGPPTVENYVSPTEATDDDEPNVTAALPGALPGPRTVTPGTDDGGTGGGTPTDPGTTPNDPGTTPTGPGTTDPGTTPTDPGTTPTDPEPEPGDPPAEERIPRTTTGSKPPLPAG